MQVVHDEQIQQSVVVDVHPRAADGPQRPEFRICLRGEAGFLGDIGERAVPVVVIERVVINAADEDIFVAVVVVVANGDAGIVTSSREARLRRDVSEVAGAVVLEQAVRVFRRVLHQRVDVGAVGEIQIELAVVVVIEDGDATLHGFGRMTVWRLAAIEAKIDGTVREANWAWNRGTVTAFPTTMQLTQVDDPDPKALSQRIKTASR